MANQLTKEDIKRNEIADVLERSAVWVKFHPQQTLWGGLGTAAALEYGRPERAGRQVAEPLRDSVWVRSGANG